LANNVSAGRRSVGVSRPSRRRIRAATERELSSLSLIVLTQIPERIYYSIDIFQTAWKFLLQKQEQGEQAVRMDNPELVYRTYPAAAMRLLAWASRIG
jgi:hypothetical protein